MAKQATRAEPEQARRQVTENEQMSDIVFIFAANNVIGLPLS